MLTGSLAATVYGEPRATQDVDLVIDPEPASLDRFLASLDRNRFYVSEGGARRALTSRDMFNVIDLATGWKIDLVVRKDRPFSRVEFERRRVVDLSGLLVAVASPEDLVLAKLEWAAGSGSERQLRDVASILAMNSSLDRKHLDRWARELGVVELLRRAEQPGS